MFGRYRHRGAKINSIQLTLLRRKGCTDLPATAEPTDQVDDFVEGDITPEEWDEQQQTRRRERHRSRSTEKESTPDWAALSDNPEVRATTYQPSRHEEGWLESSLRDFYEQGLICDIMASIKGGKEASVYRCKVAPQALEAIGSEWVAAKVYRPKQFRNLRNDALYRQGRPTLTGEGRAVKATDSRIMRALGKKSAFGQQVAHTSWLLYEMTTLNTLYNDGASVPRCFGATENALLMTYIGDDKGAASTLIETGISPREAEALFNEVLRNLRLLLSHDLIHGDLSAYNILYWKDAITLIDFPQVVNRRTNPHAEEIFTRDVRRVCEYFARMGAKCNPERIAGELWRETE